MRGSSKFGKAPYLIGPGGRALRSSCMPLLEREHYDQTCRHRWSTWRQRAGLRVRHSFAHYLAFLPFLPTISRPLLATEISFLIVCLVHTSFRYQSNIANSTFHLLLPIQLRLFLKLVPARLLSVFDRLEFLEQTCPNSLPP
jgi:hypothetical protein